MQAAVLELVDRPQVQARQVDELAHARLVEEPVADDRALDVPEEPPEHRPRRSRPERAHRRGRCAPGAAATSATSAIAARIATARRIERCTVNTTAQATKTRRERPGEDAADRALTERPRDGQAGHEHAGRAEGEPQVLDHRVTASSDRASPDERKRTPSRYSLHGREQQRPQPQRRRAAAAAPARPPAGPGAWRGSAAGRAGSRRTAVPPCEAPPTCTTSALREEQHLPAGPAEARQPVDLLAEHEEVLVEQPDRVGGLAPHEQRRAVRASRPRRPRRARSRRGRAGSGGACGERACG